MTPDQPPEPLAQLRSMTPVTVITEARFFRDSTCAIVCQEGGRAYEFWARYLAGFDRVRVLARVSNTVREGMSVEGPGVDVHPIPNARGAIGWLARNWQIRRATRAAVTRDNAHILRLPGVLGTIVARDLNRLNIPYAIELVGDPYDVIRAIAPGPIKTLAGTVASKAVAHQCSRAKAIAYVCQRRAKTAHLWRLKIAHIQIQTR